MRNPGWFARLSYDPPLGLWTRRCRKCGRILRQGPLRWFRLHMHRWRNRRAWRGIRSWPDLPHYAAGLAESRRLAALDKQAGAGGCWHNKKFLGP